jgi:Toastrack DUF4097
MKRTALTSFALLLAATIVVAAPSDHKKKTGRVERSVAATADVTVSICLGSSNLTVHGWDRPEVRVKSLEASAIDLQRTDAGGPGPAGALEVVVRDNSDGSRRQDGCQAFSNVEVNVPRGATLQLRSRDGDITVVGVRSAVVGTQSGDVTLSEISQNSEATSFNGCVSLKDSSGRVNLRSVGGSIEVSNVRPAEPEDDLDLVSVSGDVVLEHATHTRVTIRVTTGSLEMTGPLVSSGRYLLKTITGDLTVKMPADSSFSLNAKVAQDGEIVTDFPLRLIKQINSNAVGVGVGTGTGVATAPPAEPEAPPEAGPPNPPSGPAPQPPVILVTEPSGTVTPRVVARGTAVVVVAPGMSARQVVAIYGSGDAKLELASFSGTLHLQKEE